MLNACKQQRQNKRVQPRFCYKPRPNVVNKQYAPCLDAVLYETHTVKENFETRLDVISRANRVWTRFYFEPHLDAFDCCNLDANKTGFTRILTQKIFTWKRTERLI
jgi:hypothetical protein